MRQHQNSKDDLTILSCFRCGWKSEELSQEQVRDLGAPLACHGTCGSYGVSWMRFHPSERGELGLSASAPPSPASKL